MNGRFLLDTNIAVAAMNNEIEIRSRLTNGSQVGVPSVALGELYYGAAKSGRSDDNVRRVDRFAATTTVVGCDQETARQYGFIQARLRAAGKPIPTNDIWIAAVAMQHDLTLVTRDGHFEAVEGLRCARW